MVTASWQFQLAPAFRLYQIALFSPIFPKQ